MPPKKTTEELVKESQAMLAQTKAEGSTPFATSSYNSSYKPITSESLQPSDPVNFQTQPTTPIPDISTFADSLNTGLGKTETQAQDISTQLLGLTDSLGGKEAYRLQQEQAQGIGDLQATETDLTSQLKGLINEQKAVPLKLQEELRNRPGVSISGATAIEEQARQRQVAIKALSINSLLEATQGKISSARATADRAVNLKYADDESKLATLQKNLQIIQSSPAYTQEQKDRALKQELLINDRARVIEENKANDKGIQDIAITLAKYGVNPSIVKNAKTIDEAIILAGANLQDPKAKLELQNLKLDMELTKQKIATEAKQRSLMGEPTPASKQAEKQALQSKIGQNDLLKEKVTLIDGLLSSEGLNSRVGTSIVSRTPQGFLGSLGKIATVAGITTLPGDISDKFTGAGQQFAGGVHKLASKEFLDALISAKAKGATFGALTDREGDALRASATQLNDWEIKDNKGLGTGVWNIDEKSFKEELNNIKRLTNKAMVGNTFDYDESSLLDSAFGSDISSPSDYFQ